MLLPTLLLTFAGAVTPYTCKFTPYNEVEYELTAAKTHYNFAYDEVPKKIVLGQGGLPVIYFVDLHEPKAVKQGYRLNINKAKCWIRGVEYPLQADRDTHGKLRMAVEMTLPWSRWSETVYAGLQKPKDLEGIHIRVDYEFCKNNGWGHDKTCLQTKHAVFQLPETGKEVTEEEKDILKGLFYGGGHSDGVVTELKQFRMEAPPVGEKAKLNFVQYGNNWLGQKNFDIYFVDWQESEIELGNSLKFISIKISNGQREYDNVVFDKVNASFSALHFRMYFDVIAFPELKMPKDLEGLEFQFEYEFSPMEMQQNNSNAADDNPIACPLPMGERKTTRKQITLKLPKSEEFGPTEHEKDILKAIFVGGHKFRVDVARDNRAAETEFVKIDFIKDAPRYRLKFILDYSNFAQKDKVDMPWIEVRKLRQQKLNGAFDNQRSCYSDTLYYLSSFKVDWSKACEISNAEELRSVTIKIGFYMKINATHNEKKNNGEQNKEQKEGEQKEGEQKQGEQNEGEQNDNNKKKDNSILISFAQFTPGELELLFHGGTATIFLNEHESKVEYLNGPSKFTKTLKKYTDWRKRRADRPSHGGYAGGGNLPTGGGPDLGCLMGCFALGAACAQC